MSLAQAPNLAKCKICQRCFKWINYTHLKKHGLSFQDYLGLDGEKLHELYQVKGLGTREIAKLLGVRDPKTIARMIKANGIPLRKPFSENAGKPLVIPIEANESFAYFLGVVLGDGFIHKNIVCLTCKDEVFARSFYECLRKMGLNPTICFGNVHKGKRYWRVYGYSSFLVKWFKRLSLSDIESFLGDNLALIKAFVRGFYESEGCYSRNEKKSDFCIKVYNSDFGKINLFVRLVKKLGFQCSVYRYRYEGRGKSEYSIRIGRKSIVKRFLEVVNPCIKIGELRKR